MPADVTKGLSIAVDNLLDQLKCYRVKDEEKQQLRGKIEQLRYLANVYQHIREEIKSYNSGNDMSLVRQPGKPDLLELCISINKDNDFKPVVDGLCEKLRKQNLVTDIVRISFIKESDRLQSLIGKPIK